MRWLTIILLAVASISGFAIFKSLPKNTGINTNPFWGDGQKQISSSIKVRLEKYAGEARAFTIKNNLNNRYCFLIDMNIASGSNRFFIYDLKNDSILNAGLVTHGNGKGSSSGDIEYSNKTGSNCTSLGKYRIGKPYHGKFGLAYKLYGLEQTNSNAFTRFVVLHAHSCVPDHEIAPDKICRSLGCPTISPGFLKQVGLYINKSNTPTLLWIFE